MREENGVFYFDGSEDDIAFRYMWTCLTDLSFWGMIETLWRIILREPPQRYWEITDEQRRED